MFRLQDNTPEVYINNSRDFQLFCRVYDTLVNGVRFDINTIPNILDALDINDNMLPLLCTKLGFFTKENIPNDVLRVILKSFPYAVKCKGSKRGIQYAVCSILKQEGTFEMPEIIIDNENYVVRVYTAVEIINKKALKAYLEYIIPLGYTLSIEKYTSLAQTTSLTFTDDTYNTITNKNNNDISQVIGNIDTNEEYKGNYFVSQVIGNENQPKTKTGTTTNN